MVQEGFVVWFTGLPASGKTTLAQALEQELRRRGLPYVQRLDGDIVRRDLTYDLGFSKEDRDENIRRVSFVAGMLAQNGVAVLAAFISPYREARRRARARCRNFVEVYCRAALSSLIARDPKGLYKKALSGEISRLTGIDDPYEEPEQPEVICDTDRETVAESTAKVLRYLEKYGLIPAPTNREPVSVTRDPLPMVCHLSNSDRGSRSALYGSRITNHDQLIPPHGGSLVNRVLSPNRAKALQREAEHLPKISLSPYQVRELYCLATGIYSPLTGFLQERAYRTVVEGMRLPNGIVWPMPVVLPVDEVQKNLQSGGMAALASPDGKIFGVVEDIEIFERDPYWEARNVFGTDDPEHPGVARLLGEPTTLVGGNIWAIELPSITLTPAEVRAEIAARGWRTVAAFQTRNPVHRAHEYLLRCALEVCDGLLLSPLIGETKAEDMPAEVRLRSYRVLIEHYLPKERVLIAAFPANMRYAGPREAIFHALCRKNFGATHFIVGRDHAGVGNFYGPYDAQMVFDQFAPAELGIVPLKFWPAFWCQRCGGIATEKTCPHSKGDRISLSGTELRAELAQGRLPPPEVIRPEVAQILMELAGQ